MTNVIERFGFGSLGLSPSDFLERGLVIQLGQAPNRIDVLTSLSGLDDDDVWGERESGHINGLPVFFLSREALIKNKRATARKRDLADLDELESSE